MAVLAQITVGAQAVPMLTRADPVPGGADLTELRVVQPMVFGTAAFAGGRVQLHAMLDLEGATMPNGQLAMGNFGEGFFDRRHPHTYAHELIASASDLVRLPGAVHWSLTAGKGFAPFGTLDPMNRPALVYPVNHHWSQILERAVAIAALRYGPVTIEGGLFNGDEPEHPSQWPNFDRFGDSWSVRGFVTPLRGLELQVSHAQVTSPEHRLGAGLDHTMWNASGQYDRSLGDGDLSVMAEWAHTDEEGAYQFSTVLAEAQYLAGRHRPYLRVERTDRPEETRVLDNNFRSVRPHNENSNLGTTGWTTLTAGYGLRVGAAGWPVRFEGIAEVARLHVTTVTGVVFDPTQFYGRNDFWMFSVALRIAAGAPVHRMGRYGVVTGGSGNSGHTH